MNNGLAAGIDFGGTKMLGVVVDGAGSVKAEHRLPTPYDADELLRDLLEMVEVLERSAGRKVAGIGIGAGGLVSNDGVLHFGPNVGGVTQVHLASGVAEHRSDVRLVVDNDATCATWAESRFGAGRGVTEMTYIALGTGIGAGVVSGGRLLRGRNGFAGEPGHMTVEAGGVDCVCGKVGCWEAYASGRALGRFGREAAAAGEAHEVLRIAGAVDDIRGEHVSNAARAGDAQAQEILDDFALWVALGLANVVAILDPELIVLGGGLAGDADLFLPRAGEHLDEMVFGAGNRPSVPVVAAALGERSAAIGAALMTYEGA